MMDSDRILNLLSTYGGRDKVIRLSCYCLTVIADKMKDPELSDKWFKLAAQLSSARLVFRQLNDLPMVKSNIAFFTKNNAEDKLVNLLTGLVSVMYLFYGPIEHIAWLSTAKILDADSVKWWRYTVYIWVTCLSISIIKSIRKYLLISNREPKRAFLQEKRGLILDLLKDFSDLMVGINALPAGILWSQTLPKWKSGAFGAIASLIGLVKLY